MKFKTILFFAVFAAMRIDVTAQVTEGEKTLRSITADSADGWKKGGLVSLSIAQTSLHNWAAGGENSFAVNGLISVFANYKKDKNFWDNSLDVGYGLIKQGESSEYMKADDKLDLLSKYGRLAFRHFYYAAQVNFKTQMSEGRDYAKDTSKISNFMAPAYVITAAGLDYKPDPSFSAFFAPVTGKMTYVNDQDLADAGAFGVKAATYDMQGNRLSAGERIKTEFGGYIRLIYSKNDFRAELLRNISFTSKIDLFSNYINNPANVDINWETQLALKINKFISVNINTHLLYDDDISIVVDKNDDGVPESTGPKLQYKEILGVGFAYKF